MSIVDKCTVGVSDIIPDSVYNKNFLYLFIVFFPLLYKLNVNMINIVILLIFNNLKLYQNQHKFMGI
jgi:hypothetical protein